MHHCLSYFILATCAKSKKSVRVRVSTDYPHYGFIVLEITVFTHASNLHFTSHIPAAIVYVLLWYSTVSFSFHGSISPTQLTHL
mmetsp:Transcript_378/g.555  ORF Transcript_378/g.555 Transcript_378/m.555 type:complete len:84 (-) Transcript_378:93-344(-)